MSKKITEKLKEPISISTGSLFKIKIKVIRHETYEEIAGVTYEKLKEVSYNNLKGD